MSDCPRCGAEYRDGEAAYVRWACESSHVIGVPGTFKQSDACRIRALTAERDEARRERDEIKKGCREIIEHMEENCQLAGESKVAELSRYYWLRLTLLLPFDPALPSEVNDER